MSRPLAPCGTYGAYQRHLRRGETPCEECKGACAEYFREYRKNPQNLARNRAYNAARAHALEALARNHYQEFLELLAVERARVIRIGYPVEGEK